MSSHNYTHPCPVCENDMDVCETNRPYPCIDCRCRTCGFATGTQEYRESLESINDNRSECTEEELITAEEYHKRDNSPYFSSLKDMS